MDLLFIIINVIRVLRIIGRWQVYKESGLFELLPEIGPPGDIQAS